MKSKKQGKHIKSIKNIYIMTFIIAGSVLLVILLLTGLAHLIISSLEPQAAQNVPDYVDVQLIDVDGHARRGVKLDSEVHDIVIHYVANPQSTAQNNRDYFNNPETTVSSHFVVGLEGEIIMCVPLDEKSSASNDRNSDTISIEVCHEDETGKFNEASYNSLVRLTSWLCQEFSLSTEHIIRHYDITGKLCPLYYVEHEDEWENFKADVGESMLN